MALTAVVDRQAEFETVGFGVERVAGFAHDGLEAIDHHGRDHAEAVGFADMDEAVEFALRQFAHGAEKAVVARAHRKPPEVTLQDLSVARLDKPHHQRFAVAQAQDVGVLPKLVEAKRGHCKLPKFSEQPFPKSRWPASPSRGDAGLAAYARQNGFSASRMMSLRQSPTPSMSSSVHCASSRCWRSPSGQLWTVSLYSAK